MTKLPISINTTQIEACCKKYHITYLALFGSVLTPRFSASSDVDILVKFDKKHIPGLFGIFDIQQELSAIVGREVDLKTPNSLSRYFRAQVLSEAQVLFKNELAKNSPMV
jgi:predicted nucleotidyltransferase